MTLEEEFRERSDRYTRETCVLSYINTEHEDYKAIQKMGTKAIPFMLDDLNQEKGSPWVWFSLLQEMTGVWPVEGQQHPSEQYSGIRLAWLKWGVSQGLVSKILPTHEEVKTEANEIPEPYREAHRLSSLHREAIEASVVVGCFHCCEIFSPAGIEEWVDDSQTALCPHCGIDSVLPASAITTPEFLTKMRKWWF